VGRVLEGAPAVRAWRHAEQQAARGEQAIQLVDEGDLVDDVLQEVDGADHADGAVRQVQRVRQRGDDVDVRSVVLVNAQVPVGPAVRRAKVQRRQALALGPGERVPLDVAVVESDGLLLDEGVGLGVSLGVVLVHALQVQAVVDEAERAPLVQPAHQVLVVEDGPLRVVAAGGQVGVPREGADMVGRPPDIGDVVRRGR
jgi:hypothetical protein